MALFGIAAGSQTSTGQKILSTAKSTFNTLIGNTTEQDRAKRDQVKSQLLSIGVNRNAWNNFNSDSVKAGRDLLNYLQSNPAAISRFNRTFNTDINRSNVDAFINAANADLKIGNNMPGMAAVSAGPSFANPFNIAWILGAGAITLAVYLYQN